MKSAMGTVKRSLLLAAILILGFVEICLYWNSHLYYQAKEKIEERSTKIRVLERANKFYPFNDAAHYELGKAYFDLGIENLGNIELRNDYLQRSSQNFSRSLAINPTSLFAHFHFAQSLLYMSYLSLPFEVNCYEEYKKAALLTGHNSQIFYEVGKILLSRWPFLSEKEKEFTTDILKRILAHREKEKIQMILHIWDLNVKDYDVLKKILPEDPDVYRLYAQFLGEKSLLEEERQRIMTQAELLDFERARSEFHLGERELQFFRLKEAFHHFLISLDILKKTNFYQDLTRAKLIDLSEFKNIRKSVELNLAKCRLEETGQLEDADSYLRSYLALEDEVAAIGELESFLQERGAIDENFSSEFKDLNKFSFKILLDFKQNRYRNIIKIGNLLEERFLLVPDSLRKRYAEVLLLIGDSSYKLDYLYDSEHFYQKAFEIDPGNLETLIRIRKNYERLNEVEKMRKINESIARALTPQENSFSNLIINKGQMYSHPFILDGRRFLLTLHFEDRQPEIHPLVSVFFNDRIVWEGYLGDEVLSVPINSKIGTNTLRILPLNRSISLLKLSYAPEHTLRLS